MKYNEETKIDDHDDEHVDAAGLIKEKYINATSIFSSY